ncbi:hypothetical protein Glove_29g69 [Diversispora epigaea]|uniref:Uncharacterized protein n=1 Tax=Diversispora epigaea TaxID=1348612 RepID=A0A397JIT7_9GLOM|nr:hypothetical protein Glove_29g69 [Diversispora epigaea]
MARTNEKSFQEWYYVDLIAKILDDKFPFSTPLDPFIPKDENEAAIAKAKVAEYTKKTRRAAYISVEYIQRDRRKLNKTEISIIKTDRRKVCEVRGKISKAYVKLRLGIALFNAGAEKKPYYNNEYERYALGQKEEVVDVGDDGVINIHAPEVDDKDIDVVNTDWELDTNYTEARKLGIALFNAGAEKKPYYNNEYERYALGQKEEVVDVGDDGVINIHAPEVDDKDIDVVNTDWELDTNYTEARKLGLFRWDLWSKKKYKH